MEEPRRKAGDGRVWKKRLQMEEPRREPGGGIGWRKG
jgi:hypothetical protein